MSHLIARLPDGAEVRLRRPDNDQADWHQLAGYALWLGGWIGPAAEDAQAWVEFYSARYEQGVERPTLMDGVGRGGRVYVDLPRERLTPSGYADQLVGLCRGLPPAEQAMVHAIDRSLPAGLPPRQKLGRLKAELSWRLNELARARAAVLSPGG